MACQGLLEVEPLQFVCCSTSDGAKVERNEVPVVGGAVACTGNKTLPSTIAAPQLPTVSASLMALEQELQVLKVWALSEWSRQVFILCSYQCRYAWDMRYKGVWFWRCGLFLDLYFVSLPAKIPVLARDVCYKFTCSVWCWVSFWHTVFVFFYLFYVLYFICCFCKLACLIWTFSGCFWCTSLICLACLEALESLHFCLCCSSSSFFLFNFFNLNIMYSLHLLQKHEAYLGNYCM